MAGSEQLGASVGERCCTAFPFLLKNSPHGVRPQGCGCPWEHGDLKTGGNHWIVVVGVWYFSDKSGLVIHTANQVKLYP